MLLLLCSGQRKTLSHRWILVILPYSSKKGKRKRGTDTRAVASIFYFTMYLTTPIYSRSLHSSLTSPFFAFRDLRPVSLEKGQETLRLRVYGCYAWGGPLLVAGLAALLDHLPSQPQYTFLRPRFGEKQCWFYGKFLHRPAPRHFCVNYFADT